MSYPVGFYSEHVRLQSVVSREKRIVREYPPEIPDWDRDALFASMAYYGRPGSGKTMCMLYDSLERYSNIHKPELGVPNGMKIVCLDLLGKGEYCLPTGSLVFSEGEHPIEQCAIGDSVLGHDGMLHRVTQVFRRSYSGTLVKITPSNFGLSIRLTPEHPILVCRVPKQQSTDRKLLSRAEVKWVNASQITLDDHVGIPYYWAASKRTQLKLKSFLKPNQYVETKDGFILRNWRKKARQRMESLPIGLQRTPLPSVIHLSPEFLRLLGFFVAEGATTQRTGSEIRWCFGKHERVYADFVREVLLKSLGVHASIKRIRSCCIVSAHCSLLRTLLRQWFGGHAREKKIPSWILTLSHRQQIHFLYGLWRGDGCISHERKRNMPHMVYMTASKQLAYGVFTLLCRLRIPSRIDWRHNSGGYGKGKLAYRVLVTGASAQRLARLLGYDIVGPEMRHNNHAFFIRFAGKRMNASAIMWVPIRSIEKEQYDGDVFNLAVDGCNSYSTPIAVHNCSVGIPMTEKHPLYPKLIGIYGKNAPESYPVEILRPLVFTNGRPNLPYRQPKVVRPFTIALQDISMDEWSSLVGLTPAQQRLHDAVLRKARSDPHWLEMGINDFYVIAQSMLGSRRIAFTPNIDGLEKSTPIPIGNKVYSGREASGLMQRYEKLMNLSIIMPQESGGKPVSTNLDMRKILSDKKTISVFLLPDVEDASFLNYAVANYVLQRIFWLKHPNTPDRVKAAISVAIPEASKAVPNQIKEGDQKRYFLEPLKNTVTRLASQAPGMGVQMNCDAQRPLDLDPSFRELNAVMKIFDLGENAAEVIRELLKGRSVMNFREITDENSRFLTALRERGTFVHIGFGSAYAELASNAIVGTWYPRASGSSGESETSFYQLYERHGKPEDWTDIGHMYAELTRINFECQNRAAANMNEILDKEEDEKASKKKSGKRGYDLPEDPMILGFMLNLVEETGLDHWDSHADLVKRLSEKARLPTHRIRKFLRRFNSRYILVDKTEGKTRERVTILTDRIRKTLDEAQGKSAEEDVL